MNYYFKAIQNYFNFNGRANRKEYWIFAGVHVVVLIFLSMFAEMLEIPMLANAYAIVMAIPTLAVGVRRVHDVNHSGWFVLVPLYNLYLYLSPGNEQANRWGPVPEN